MSILVPHWCHPPQRHEKVPYLWRIGCSCGWSAFAPSQENCRAAFLQHQVEEEPFPTDDIFEEKDSPHERKD